MLIDIHTHVVPENFPMQSRSGCSGWPRMLHGTAGAILQVDGKDVRRLDARSWDVDARLAAMDVEGADVHVLSPMPDLFAYWLPAEDALELARTVNRTIAEMVRRSPRHFVGLGTVPLQNVALAIDELPRLKYELGLAGIEAGAFINGEALGSPRFFPLFAALEALDLALFVHPVRSVGISPALGIPPELAINLVDYPVDQGRCVTAFLGNGVARSFPGLRVAFAHGGGAFPTILPRLQIAWERNARARESFVAAPIEMAKDFFFDSLVYRPPQLRMLVEALGPERICIGTDEPFEIRQRRPATVLNALSLSPADTEAILNGNARHFLGSKL